MNDRSGPKAASVVVPTTNRNSTAAAGGPARDTYPVTGELLIDLSDLPRFADIPTVRQRIGVAEQAPAGALVRLVVGDQWPSEYAISGLFLRHVAIVVVCVDTHRLRKWVHLLREATR